jgi:preprotein translocase subunit SecD
MRRGLPVAGLIALGAAVLTVLRGSSTAAEDGARVLTLRAVAFDADAPAPVEAAKAAAEVVAARCRHAGFDGVTADATDGTVRVTVPTTHAADEPAIRRLAERRAAIEFRIRAKTSDEDEWRDRRLQSAAVPPAGLVWCEPLEGVSKILVEAPEEAAAARLEAANKKDPADPAAVKKAHEELERVRRESVFTNADVGASSVQRTMRSWGAQRFLHKSVRFEMKEGRRDAFEQFTGWRVGRDLCVVVDGKVRFCAPIPAAMPGSGELHGPGTGYTEEEARELAAWLVSGPLPCRLVPKEPR